MPIRNRRPEDDQPLIRAVQGPGLIRPAGTGQAETAQETGGTQAAQDPQGTGQGQKGPIASAIDRAQENNWVYPSMANAARERGLLDKADEVLGRIRAQLGA